MRKGRIRKVFWLRQFISFMVIVSLYVLLFVLPQIKAEKKDEPRRQLAAFRAALEENRLLLNSFSGLDTKSVGAAEALETLSARLTDSRSRLIELSDQRTPELNQESFQKIKDYLGLEKQLIDQYQARFIALAKIVLYNPAEDLKTADPAEMLARANDTAQALKNFANKSDYTVTVGNIDYTFQLPTETQGRIKASADCFHEYAILLGADSVEAAQKKLGCISEYSETRGSTVAAITSVFNSELAERINQSITDLITALDSNPIK
jgi:hypothetical protein